MLLFAHIGITLGAARLLTSAPIQRRFFPKQRGEALSIPDMGTGSNSVSTHPQELSVQDKSIDYRLVIIGSLLPDIIDKPIGMAFFSSGRMFAHTSLFALILVIIGLLLYRRGRRGMLTVSLCSTGHLLLDLMWQEPEILFWPLYGWGFAPADLSNWIPGILHDLGTKPGLLVPDVIGAIIAAGFLAWLIKNRGVLGFIRNGTI